MIRCLIIIAILLLFVNVNTDISAWNNTESLINEVGIINDLNMIETEYSIDQSSAKDNKLRYSTITLISISSVLFLTLLFLLYRLKATRDAIKRIEDECLIKLHDFKNKELIQLMMFRTKEIKIKKSLSLRLKKINSGYSDNKSMIKSMLEEYESDEEGLWEEFEIRFRDIHEEFYNSLIERFPELTKSEIRLCTLLRLDLNTKEIANMLDKSTASIEVYRANVRKKLGLTMQAVNLAGFLKKI